MKKDLYLTILFDYYEALLNKTDQQTFKDYYFSNFSMQEIADSNKISKNAVHKRLKKIEEELLSYEKKLKLYEKEQKIMNLIKDENLKNELKRILN